MFRFSLARRALLVLAMGAAAMMLEPTSAAARTPRGVCETCVDRNLCLEGFTMCAVLCPGYSGNTICAGESSDCGYAGLWKLYCASYE